MDYDLAITSPLCAIGSYNSLTNQAILARRGVALGNFRGLDVLTRGCIRGAAYKLDLSHKLVF